MHVPAVAVGLRCAVTEIVDFKNDKHESPRMFGGFYFIFLPKSDNKMIAR